MIGTSQLVRASNILWYLQLDDEAEGWVLDHALEIADEHVEDESRIFDAVDVLSGLDPLSSTEWYDSGCFTRALPATGTQSDDMAAWILREGAAMGEPDDSVREIRRCAQEIFTAHVVTRDPSLRDRLLHEYLDRHGEQLVNTI